MSKNGIYVDENTFVSFEQLNRSSMFKEYATRKRSMDLSSMFGYLPNPDTVLRKMGRSISVYNDLLVDSHIGAVTEARKDSILAMEWEIDRDKANSTQAVFFEDLFDDLDIYKICSEILDAPLYGYQVLEVMWQKVGKYWLPVDVVGKPQDWFVFDDENVLKMVTNTNRLGEDIPDKKFLLATHNATYMNPYGFPVLSRCFWPATFKKGGMKFWVAFTEKFGMPWVIGKHPRGIGESEISQLADSLEAMVQDAVAAIPDDGSVELLESGSKGGSITIYETLAKFCNSEISKGVLGNTLTTEIQGQGSYAASEIHMQKEEKKADTDKRIVEKVLNQLISWVQEFNFASGEKPKFELYQEEDVDQALATRDKTLSDTGQVKFTKKYFTRNYDFAEDEIEVVEPKEPTPNPSRERNPVLPAKEFNSPILKGAGGMLPDQKAIDNVLENLDAKTLQSLAIQTLQPVIDLVQSSSSYEQVMENLVELYPEMDTAQLEEMLARANFVSEVWGKVSIEE